MDLCQLVDHPTYHTGNTLDHITARSNDTYKDEMLTRSSMLTDHNWVLFQISTILAKKTPY